MRERPPAVAGSFYSADRGQLEHDVQRLIVKPSKRAAAVGIVVPHAGYMYSGAVAGQTYGSVEPPQAVIVVAVDHHGRGPEAATTRLPWRTPLGLLEVDPQLLEALLEHAPWVEDDPQAQALEHSLEVQLPFIQWLWPQARFLPVQVRTHDAARLRSLGLALARLAGVAGERTLLVASTDLSHYEPDARARELDRIPIERILALDPEGLLREVLRHRVSMCGVAPTTAVLYAARELQASRAQQVAYATSADAGGDPMAVVGYLGAQLLTEAA